MTNTTTLQDSLKAFEDAYARMERELLAQCTIYCLCGREFPEGTVKRIVYGSVQYAEDRCGHCSGEYQ